LNHPITVGFTAILSSRRMKIPILGSGLYGLKTLSTGEVLKINIMSTFEKITS
jgi:hypothetical protein